MPAGDRRGLAMMVAVSGVATDVAVHYESLGDEEESVVTLGCGEKRLLEEFCQDLDAVDLRIEWVGSIHGSSPVVRDVHAADDLAMPPWVAEIAGAQPTNREPSGGSLVVVTERLGHAAASVMPPTQASQRARDALAAA